MAFLETPEKSFVAANYNSGNTNYYNNNNNNNRTNRKACFFCSAVPCHRRMNCCSRNEMQTEQTIATDNSTRPISQGDNLLCAVSTERQHMAALPEQEPI